MNIEKGHLYFVTDSFFDVVRDPYLKRDHESTKRPHYFAYQESDSPLLWIIPCSSQVAKYQRIIDEKKAMGKQTDILKIVRIQGNSEVLLFQDMFPVLPHYLSEPYIRGNQPVYIADPAVVEKLERNAKKVIGLIRRGIRFTPTQPDVLRIEKMMLAESAGTLSAMI